jgi:hypothetical protein
VIALTEEKLFGATAVAFIEECDDRRINRRFPRK